jgi:hypothetical protein
MIQEGNTLSLHGFVLVTVKRNIDKYFRAENTTKQMAFS